MIRSLIGATAIAFPLVGCTVPDAELGLVHAQNLALAQATPVDPSRPLEGGSAQRGAFAQQRYIAGNTRPLASPPAPQNFEPSRADIQSSPK